MTSKEAPKEILDTEHKPKEPVPAKGQDQPPPSKYQPGEVLKFVRVRFPGNAKSFPFLVERRNFSYGQKVVAMSDRGMTVGYINSFPYETTFNKSMLPIKSISKEASQEDISQQKDYAFKEKEAEILCLNLIEKYKLDMVLTHVEFLQFGKKAVFYFNAPTRVDFRNLVKDLVKDLKMRIELRQISVRDRTAALGAIGPCGLQTCCSSFLKSYGNVSIKLAKNQNLALIANKINGVCGQIKCCVKYEDEVYSEKRSRLPKEGSFVFLKNGDKGKVTKLQILSEKFDIMTDEGKLRRYEGPLFDPKRTLPENWSFPSSFEHIVNETSTLIKADNKEPEPVKEPKVTIDQPVKMTPTEKKEVEAKDSERQSRRPDKKKKYRRRGQSNSRPPKKKGP